MSTLSPLATPRNPCRFVLLLTITQAKAALAGQVNLFISGFLRIEAWITPRRRARYQRIHAAAHGLYPKCVAALVRGEMEVRGRRVVGK